MPIPETPADLDDYERRGDLLFSWENNLGRHPQVEQHIVAAKLAAVKLGFGVDNNEVRIPATEAQLAERIANKRERWTVGGQLYNRLLAEEIDWADLTYSEQGAARYYATREDVLAPDRLAAGENH